EVGDGELQLMHPQPSGLVAGREAEPPAEVEEDVGGLADDELAGLEERRRKRRTRAASAFDEFHHRGNAALAGPARHVDVVGARLLQREADELAAPLDRRPVIELVPHGGGPWPCWLVMRARPAHPSSFEEDRPPGQARG